MTAFSDPQKENYRTVGKQFSNFAQYVNWMKVPTSQWNGITTEAGWLAEGLKRGNFDGVAVLNPNGDVGNAGKVWLKYLDGSAYWRDLANLK